MPEQKKGSVGNIKIIVGLGNPGRQYQGTRHNLGHWLISRLKNEWENKPLPKPRIIWAQNRSFMNEAGKDVAQLVRRHRVELKDLLLLHDDLDIPLGEFRLQFNRSSAGHRGVQSVIDELGSPAFWRLRVGIGRPPAGETVDDFVLGRFSLKEQQILDALYPRLFAIIRDWLLRD